jgi:pimeloyl-ACP methyl ester carboxylesterase
VTFPRGKLAEFNTHRMLSRNSESARAMPPEMTIERVLADPYIPEFGSRVKGMGVGDPLPDMDAFAAGNAWLDARDAAVGVARKLLSMNVAKEQVNEVLTPFMWHTVIVTATEWDNFFALRAHKDAAPSLRKAVVLMKQAIAESSPRVLTFGQWHLPLVEQKESPTHSSQFAGVSAGRCARSSYSTHHNPESAQDSFARWIKLAQSGHWSPGEHPAECVRGDMGLDLGNFRGWRQLRKFYPQEAVFKG